MSAKVGNGGSPEARRFSLSGQAFLKLARGQDTLSGMKVQLVAAKTLWPKWEATMHQMQTRFVAYDAFQIAKQKNSNQETKQLWVAALAAKESELSHCNKVGWSTCNYIDPITGKGNVIEVNEKTKAHMKDRIEAVRQMLPRFDALDMQLETRLDAKMRELATMNPKLKCSAPTERAGALEIALDGNHSEGEIVFRGTRDIVAMIDSCTVDETVVDAEGDFEFQQIAEDTYVIYAYHQSDVERVTWLLPVKWDPGQGPRRAIISTQNSVDMEDAIRRGRVGGMTDSIKKQLISQ
ncbi:hypothetical protein CVU37_09460 [candidate division BRC1 bacterium HGW-BRC1-1]|nr:MAG: hypothetical protein CVU37_09460 [candidate division BRC1 bacterium HGW-BRC1-1]